MVYLDSVTGDLPDGSEGFLWQAKCLFAANPAAIQVSEHEHGDVMRGLALAVVSLLGVLPMVAQKPEYPLMPSDYWASQKTVHNGYPPLAALARIQGEVITEAIIHPTGVPIKVTAISGPAQLRAYAEYLVWSMSLADLPKTPVGPWKCYFGFDFQLKGRQVVVQAMSQERANSITKGDTSVNVQTVSVDDFNRTHQIGISRIARNSDRRHLYMMMGSHDVIVGGKPMPIPYEIDFQVNPTDGKPVEVVYYCTGLKQKDGANVAKEFTPFVVVGGVLVDWGWSCLDSMKLKKLDLH